MASGMMEFLPLCFSPSALRAYLAEFISTFLFMFATAGSAVSARMVTPDATSDASSLVTTAVAQAFALFVAAFIAADASGGHANPAVTFAFAIGGHIAVPTAVLYWVAQLLGATLACLVVHTLSAGQAVPTTRIAADMTGFGASVLEAVTTFMVVYTVHAACDPRVLRAGGRRGATETATGSLAVGLVTGACALATASLTGASMNPARSFGPAVVGEDFTNQAVYWAGPMAGAALAVLVHQHVVYPASSLADPEARRGSVETVVA